MKNNTVDLRSDTVTKPTPAMLEAMMQAEVGDDVFREDPTVRQLEEKTAAMFGMEAGLFCPSGTMTNQIAIKLLTQPGQEVVCDKRAHIYNYEGGGIAFNSGASVRLLDGDRGRITASQVKEAINPKNDIHFPETALVALENTVNKGGGSIYTIPEIKSVSEVCKENGLSLHLDGARVFNALIETGEDPKEYGKLFDTISVCLSKGLGVPVGSVLLGSKLQMERARRIRKVFGGGMRQAGYLAAAGVYALDHHINRLKEDHRRAEKLGKALEGLPYVKTVEPVATNIVLFEIQGIAPTQFLAQLQQNNVRAVGFGGNYIRFVTHLDFNDAQMDYVVDVLKDRILVNA